MFTIKEHKLKLCCLDVESDELGGVFIYFYWTNWSFCYLISSYFFLAKCVLPILSVKCVLPVLSVTRSSLQWKHMWP